MNTQSSPTKPLRARMTEDMTARGLGTASQCGHLRACEQFAVWLGRSPETATAEEVKAFQLWLTGDGATAKKRNRIMTGVKFLFRVTLRRHDLVAEIFHLKEPRRVPQVLSQDEVRRLLVLSPDLRARTMLSLAYGCGLRASEVVKPRVGDIDSAQGIIRVLQSKSAKDRNVMLPAEVLGLLREWWQERPTRKDAGVAMAERWLLSGRLGRRGYLTARHFSRVLKDALAAAGISKRVTLHTLRHSFATHLLERDEDIRVIQALVGHA